MFDAFDRFARADEHAASEAVRAGGHVDAVVHAVREIHVGVACRPEHRAVAFAAPVIRVACRVVLVVGLRFHDADGAACAVGPVAHQQAAEQSGGRMVGAMGEQFHGECVPVAVLVVDFVADPCHAASFRPARARRLPPSSSRIWTAADELANPRLIPRVRRVALT